MAMTTAFALNTRQTLLRCGWDVGKSRAHISADRDGKTAVAFVHADGRWSVETGAFTIMRGVRMTVLAQGKEAEPAAAAMDANEILWAWRDGRNAPDHLQQKLTEPGRTVL